jgi:PAS domain S-box-containing protein
MADNDKQTVLNLFMQAPVGFFLLRGDEHIVEKANEMGLKLTKKSPDIIGKKVKDAFPEVEGQGFIELLDGVKKTGQPVILNETPVIFIKDGKEETSYLNLIYQPYYEDGKIEGVFSISTDVTALVHARKEAEEMREQFETMANNIPNLAWITDSEGWIIWYNSRWFEYTGTTAKQMEGWGWQSVPDPAQLEEVLERWYHSLKTGEPFEMVISLKGADNVYRPFLTRILPIYNNEGKVIGWFGTNTDIVKQKELETMKDDFLSATSHELNTPVTTLKAYAHMTEKILEENGDTKALPMIKKMNRQVNKLASLIEELLVMTRIQKDKLIYKESFFDINKLLKHEVEDMQSISPQHQIMFVPGKEEKIFGDKDKISQVLTNLLSNAVKYSPHGKSILVSLERQDDGVRVCVQDFGIGIPAQDIKNIFQQFYQVTSHATYPGLGVGLYISSEIIKKHKGKIWADSTLDAGSTFYIWLPFDHRNT